MTFGQVVATVRRATDGRAQGAPASITERIRGSRISLAEATSES
ncbi:MAG: hypothetical protein QOK15_3753 [Nocardioidaceae bacterium]|jgi:hypothetical protein|nr:hypothetical protein [Nocardioidaceae bacterium]